MLTTSIAIPQISRKSAPSKNICRKTTPIIAMAMAVEENPYSVKTRWGMKVNLYLDFLIICFRNRKFNKIKREIDMVKININSGWFIHQQMINETPLVTPSTVSALLKK